MTIIKCFQASSNTLLFEHDTPILALTSSSFVKVFEKGDMLTEFNSEPETLTFNEAHPCEVGT